jgi:osmotically-inducible protein OsmY
MRTSCKYVWLLLVVLTGCNRQDTEALQRISRKVIARSEALTGEVKNSAVTQWHGAQPDASLEARVSARLRWDKQIADIPLEVKAVGNTIEVKGKVRNLDQRRRVVMLAESTTGVEGVRDLLVESDR